MIKNNFLFNLTLSIILVIHLIKRNVIYGEEINMKNHELKQIEKILNNLKIRKQDNIYLGVDLMKFSLNLRSNLNFDELSNLILKILLKKIGKGGTLVIPVFNFDCIHAGKFNRKKTLSQCGAFGNSLLKKYYRNRSSHPMYSFLFFGNKSKYYINKNDSNAFAINSCWKNFIDEDYKMITLGHHYGRSFTIAHYLERISSVSYRFDKNFKLNYSDFNNSKKNKEYQIFARKLNKCKFSAITKVCDSTLRKKKIFIFYKHKKLICFNLGLKKSCKLILDNLKKNKPIFLDYIHTNNKNINKVLNDKNIFELEQFYQSKY